MKKFWIKIVMAFLIVMMIFGCSKKETGKTEENDSFNSVEVSSKEEKLKDHHLEDEEKDKEEIEDNEDTSADKNESSTTKTEESSITVSVQTKVVTQGKTFTGLPGLQPVEYIVQDPNNNRELDTTRNPFSFGAAQGGTPHSITVDNQRRFDGYDLNALAWDNKTSGKVLYLTFDCGYRYENLTERILDTLKEKNVKAAFFCTLSYLQADPEVASRMISEGHIVGNHSTTHPDCTTISRKEFAEELLGVNNYLRVNFGYETKYFRFPTGAYSQNALELADSLGYRSIFWSVAHSDWDPENQPGVEKSFETVTSRLHPGAVILLHSTSPDNADILEDLIDYARANGYEFKTLDEYDYWN